MRDFEGIPHQQPFDESPVPVTDKNAESPLDTSLSAASTENAESCPCKKAYEESGKKKNILHLMSIVCNAMIPHCSVLKHYHGCYFPKHD